MYLYHYEENNIDTHNNLPGLDTLIRKRVNITKHEYVASKWK